MVRTDTCSRYALLKQADTLDRMAAQADRSALACTPYLEDMDRGHDPHEVPTSTQGHLNRYRKYTQEAQQYRDEANALRDKAQNAPV